MRIYSHNHIQSNTISRTGGTPVIDQGTSFAEQMEKAAAKAAKRTDLTTADAAAKSDEDAKLKAACKEMEAVFLNMLLTRMRATVPKGNLLGNSSEEQLLTSLLDTELTKNMAQAGGIGLADMLYRQLNTSIGKSQAVR